MKCKVCNHPHDSHAMDGRGVGHCHKCRAGDAYHVFKEDNAPEFPDCPGRIVSVTCPCGWEVTYIFPEEANLFLLRVLEHIRDKHDIAIPPMQLVHH